MFGLRPAFCLIFLCWYTKDGSFKLELSRQSKENVSVFAILLNLAFKMVKL